MFFILVFTELDLPFQSFGDPLARFMSDYVEALVSQRGNSYFHIT